jgi:heptosyltransferase-1
MKQLLLVKMSSLGDVVHALPAVSEAVAAGWQVDWVVEEAFADIARLHPGVRRVIPIAWRRWRKHLLDSRAELGAFWQTLRASQYDYVLDSQGLIKSALVSLAAQGRRAGYAHTSAREPWASFVYRDGYAIAKQQHAITRQRQLFAKALGYELGQNVFEFGEIPTPADRKVLLLHGTTWASKHWPDAMWVALTELVIQSGYDPIVTWGDETEQARAELLGLAGAQVLARQSLASLAETIKSMQLVITVDSGLGHLSAALGVPTLGLYGPTSGELTGCVGARAQTLQGEAACVPCLKKNCTYKGVDQIWQDAKVVPACFASLSPQKVWTAALALEAAE